MSERNASASAFGWDFQANSAILLMLENIKDAKRIRVEGADEDIEVTLQDKTLLSSIVCRSLQLEMQMVLDKG